MIGSYVWPVICIAVCYYKNLFPPEIAGYPPGSRLHVVRFPKKDKALIFQFLKFICPAPPHSLPILCFFSYWRGLGVFPPRPRGHVVRVTQCASKSVTDLVRSVTWGHHITPFLLGICPHIQTNTLSRLCDDDQNHTKSTRFIKSQKSQLLHIINQQPSPCGVTLGSCHVRPGDWLFPQPSSTWLTPWHRCKHNIQHITIHIESINFIRVHLCLGHRPVSISGFCKVFYQLLVISEWGHSYN